MPRRRRLAADLVLVLVSFFWGSTFVLVKEAVALVPVTPFLAVRFLLSGLLMLALFARRLGRLDRGSLAAGALLGAVLAASYGLQTFGLRYTSAGRAGFVTGVSVVLVPLLSALVFGARPGAGPVAGALLAVAGLYLLSSDGWRPAPGAPGANRGDLLVLGCAVGFAWHILLTGRFARRFDPVLLATAQVCTAGLLAGAAAVAFEGGIPLRLPAVVWRAVAVTSIFATVVAFVAQTIAQRFTTPTRTALAFALEPIFAALVAWLYGGEALTRSAVAGGALVVLGMVAAEIGPEGRGA